MPALISKRVKDSMRKHYIDNIRIICILLLFPFHTSRMFNSIEAFYVEGTPIAFCDMFIDITSKWFMPILYLLAGVSAYYALKKRTSKEYIRERFFKLIIPFIFGMTLIVPPQTYFAEVQHNAYTGGFFEQYGLFFTKVTDFSGYRGGLTPGNTWFMLCLFLISLLMLPLILLYNKKSKKINGEKWNILKLILLFMPNALLSGFEVLGERVGLYISLFMLGYIFISDDNIQNILDKNRFILLGSAIILNIINLIKIDYGNFYSPILTSVSVNLMIWVTILAIIGLGKHYLNFRNKFTDYFNKASFPIYIFHQTWLVAVGYFAMKITNIVALQIIMIITFGFIFTVLTYEIAKRTPITRFMFGIKK